MASPQDSEAAKTFDHHSKGFTLVLRLITLVILVTLLTFHVRSMRVFRWEQSVSGGLLVTYVVAVLGLALGAGLQQGAGMVFQINVPDPREPSWRDMFYPLCPSADEEYSDRFRRANEAEGLHLFDRSDLFLYQRGSYFPKMAQGWTANSRRCRAPWSPGGAAPEAGYNKGGAKRRGRRNPAYRPGDRDNYSIKINIKKKCMTVMGMFSFLLNKAKRMVQHQDNGTIIPFIYAQEIDDNGVIYTYVN